MLSMTGITSVPFHSFQANRPIPYSYFVLLIDSTISITLLRTLSAFRTDRVFILATFHLDMFGRFSGQSVLASWLTFSSFQYIYSYCTVNPAVNQLAVLDSAWGCGSPCCWPLMTMSGFCLAAALAWEGAVTIYSKYIVQTAPSLAV